MIPFFCFLPFARAQKDGKRVRELMRRNILQDTGVHLDCQRAERDYCSTFECLVQVSAAAMAQRLSCFIYRFSYLSAAKAVLLYLLPQLPAASCSHAAEMRKK